MLKILFICLIQILLLITIFTLGWLIGWEANRAIPETIEMKIGRLHNYMKDDAIKYAWRRSYCKK